MSNNRSSENYNIEVSTEFVMDKMKEIESDINDLRKQNANSHERCFDRLSNLEKAEIVIKEQYKAIMKQIDDIASTNSNLKHNVSDMGAIHHKLDTVKSDYDIMHKDFREIRDSFHKMDNMKHDYAELEKDVNELKKEVKELTSRPAKKWEMTSNQIWTLVVAAIFAIVAHNIGLI